MEFSVGSGPNFTGIFFTKRGRIALDHMPFRFLISCPFPEIFAIKAWSCRKSPEILHVLAPIFWWAPPNFWSCIIKRTHFPIMWRSLAAIGSVSSLLKATVNVKELTSLTFTKVWQLISWFIWCFVFHERLQRFSVHLLCVVHVQWTGTVARDSRSPVSAVL